MLYSFAAVFSFVQKKPGSASGYPRSSPSAFSLLPDQVTLFFVSFPKNPLYVYSTPRGSRPF